MSSKYIHLREKAIQLRTQQQMTLSEIVERLQLPKTTVYGWIKDIPIPRTSRQSERQRKGTQAMQARYTALRDQAYQRGLEEAPGLLQDLTFRDFVVLYMAEGSKRKRNVVEFVNSDWQLIKLAHRWLQHLSDKPLRYRLQFHADHDPEKLKIFWASLLGIESSEIQSMRKSNSNALSGRQFRSVHGLLTLQVNDTYFRARVEAWMDFVKKQW